MASVADLIHGSYITIFNRAADPQGALFWSNNLGFSNIGAAAAAPGSLALADQLGANFYAAASTAFNTLYPLNISDDEFINQLYRNLGGLPPDDAGANFWLNRLNFLETQTSNSQVARAEVAGEIAFALQTFDPNATGDAKIRAQTYQNKILVSESIVNTGNPVFNPASQSLTDPAYLGETDILVGVTDAATSVAVAQAQIAAANAANNPALIISWPPPLTLTINPDTLTASFNGAAFTAPPGWNFQGQQYNTLNAGDNLTDTGINGTLNYTAVASLHGNPALAAGVTMNGIVNANILNTSAGVAGFSGNITGLTTANMQAGSNGNVLLGLASAGLNTALANIGISADSNFTAWIAAAALTGAANSVNVNLHGNNSSLDLNVTGGENNGYETAIIRIADGPNIFDMDVNYTSLATINVVGSRALTMDTGSTALNIANLHMFNGTAATGPLKIAFGGTGNVTVDGGSNNDVLTFPATDSVITARGNAGDDIFEFLATNDGATTFNNLDSVDGGTGTNRLILEVDNGQLLWAGVGEKILNIGTIQHNSVGTTNGTVSANMGQLGSATVLQLNGQYGGNDVAITNLVTGKSVLFTGSLIDDLNMDATNLVGVINLTMAQTAVGGTQEIKSLNITVGREVNLTSAGNAALNVIDGADNINANMAISGSKELHLGLEYAYDFAGGIINAIQQGVAGSIGLQIGLGNGAQALTLGVGNDLVFERTSDAGDLIQLGPLATGGTDVVRFQSTFGNAGLNINSVNYHTIAGFNVANDVIQLDVPAISLEKTNNTAVSNPPATFLSSIGQSVDLSANLIDMIKYDTAISGNLTADGYFDAAIGAGTITVNAGADEILFSLYNNDSQQMLIFMVDPRSAGSANQITAADNVHVLAVVGMSFADFQTFGNNGSMVFV